MSLRALAVVLLLIPALAPAAGPPNRVDRVRLGELFNQLDDDAFAVRHKADGEIRGMGKVALPALKAELARTKSLEVRTRLRRIVADLSFDERVDGLVKLLGDHDTLTRERAAWTLRQAGTAVVPMLQKVLSPEMPREQRTRVEKIIAELAPPR